MAYSRKEGEGKLREGTRCSDRHDDDHCSRDLAAQTLHRQQQQQANANDRRRKEEGKKRNRKRKRKY